MLPYVLTGLVILASVLTSVVLVVVTDAGTWRRLPAWWLTAGCRLKAVGLIGCVFLACWILTNSSKGLAENEAFGVSLALTIPEIFLYRKIAQRYL